MRKKTKKSPVRTQKTLTPKSRGHRIQNVREIVVKQMKERDWTAYRLAIESGVVEQTVRNFVLKKREIRSDLLEKLLSALGLEIRPKQT